MPLETKSYDLQETITELESEREDVAEQLAGMDPESNAVDQLASKGQRLDRYIGGLRYHRDEYDYDTLVLGALTNGERHMVRDTAEKAPSANAGRQNAYVAMGTLEAGYLEHNPDSIRQDEFEATIQNVTRLHPAFVDWVESEVTGMGRMGGGTGKSFADLVLEKKTQAVLEETNG